MLAMLSRILQVALLAIVGLARAASVTNRQAITTLSSAEIETYKPYTFYAATAYCQPSLTLSWSCGGLCWGRSIYFGTSELIFTTTPDKCTGNPTFKPYASGGDGSAVQYCM